jgi:hypothetical protein
MSSFESEPLGSDGLDYSREAEEESLLSRFVATLRISWRFVNRKTGKLSVATVNFQEKALSKRRFGGVSNQQRAIKKSENKVTCLETRMMVVQACV